MFNTHIIAKQLVYHTYCIDGERKRYSEYDNKKYMPNEIWKDIDSSMCFHWNNFNLWYNVLNYTDLFNADFMRCIRKILKRRSFYDTCHIVSKFINEHCL